MSIEKNAKQEERREKKREKKVKKNLKLVELSKKDEINPSNQTRKGQY